MFLPINYNEMKSLGWENLDILLITGDAYIDHPSFGVALIGKYLLKNGFKVGILAQPNIHNNQDFQKFPPPKLFVGISSGNVDSMINNYTANKNKRKTDDYSEEGVKNRPDRALIHYSHKAKENYKNVPIVLGGIEASLRRFAHYDYWDDNIRSSVLDDSKADILVYGSGERAALEIALRLQKKEQILNIPNTALLSNKLLESMPNFLMLPTLEEIKNNKKAYLEMLKTIYTNNNPYLEIGFIQKLEGKYLIVNPPQKPLDIDEYYNLSFERLPHFSYKKRIPAFDMIKDSVTIHRGCFGGCSFCAIAIHQGKFIQSRSVKSILKEVSNLKAKTITDLGGPSANMYKLGGKNLKLCKVCKRMSCLYPNFCKNLNTSHKELLSLYKQVKSFKRFFINSGVRHDLALSDPLYIKALAKDYVSGLLKIAPEHTETNVLKLMFKPDIRKFEEFYYEFKKYSQKEQYILPYLISSFPGCTNLDALKMMNYLKKNRIRVEQIQDFIPAPLTLASGMYYAERNLEGQSIFVAKKLSDREKQRSMIQYFKKN